MTKKIAEVVSLLFNPLFLIVVLLILGILESNLSQTKTLVLLLLILFFNGFAPSVFLLYYSRRGIVIDDIVYNKSVIKNRAFLLGWGTIVLFLELIALFVLRKPEPLFALVVALFLLVLALFSINIYRKISLHAAGITFFCFSVLALFGLSFWPILLMIPLICWSRLYLVRHTIKQLGAGFSISLLILAATLYFLHIPIS